MKITSSLSRKDKLYIARFVDALGYMLIVIIRGLYKNEQDANAVKAVKNFDAVMEDAKKWADE